MRESDFYELLRLTRENNEMLERIVAYVDKVDSQAYRDNEDMKALVSNLVADAFFQNRNPNQNNR